MGKEGYERVPFRRWPVYEFPPPSYRKGICEVITQVGKKCNMVQISGDTTLGA